MGEQGASRNICIVTPDAIPAVACGGIGTHVLYLARVLAERHRVTVLYATPAPGTPRELPAWRGRYRRWNIAFEMLDSASRRGTGGEPHFAASMAVAAWLGNRDFDLALFQDWRANGFHAIQAKRTLNRFSRTTLCVAMHSNTEWIDAGMRQWSESPLATAKLAWMERYCHRHCDALVSPSRYMFEWAEAAGWELCPSRFVLPNCYLGEGEAASRSSAVQPSRLAFFGRLETRKGLELFCQAVGMLLSRREAVPERVVFIGKHGRVGNEGSAGYLRRFARACAGRIRVSIESGLDTFQALALLRESGAVAVLPSLTDNYPYAAVECVENGIPFIASRVGGIPELAADAVLFDPDAGSLAAKLAELPRLDFSGVRHPYDAASAREGWLGLAEKAVVRLERKPNRNEPAPFVSICVAYYNHEKYLGQLADSILAGTYENYEVILVNDGSARESADAAFDAVESRLAGLGNWRFVRQANGGVSAARNAAAALARGEFLVFMDADNCAKPHMLAVFAAAMTHSRADCLTCHFEAFRGDAAPGPGTPVAWLGTPHGACLEAGICQNVFGDANFIVRREVFEELGGFTVIPGVSWEDYEFLARLALSGRVLDAIPEKLFWYRHLDASFSRTTDQYLNRRRILDAYGDKALPHQRRINSSMLIPAVTGARTRDALWNAVRSALPAGTVRGEAARKAYRLYRDLCNARR